MLDKEAGENGAFPISSKSMNYKNMKNGIAQLSDKLLMGAFICSIIVYTITVYGLYFDLTREVALFNSFLVYFFRYQYGLLGLFIGFVLLWSLIFFMRFYFKLGIGLYLSEHKIQTKPVSKTKMIMKETTNMFFSIFIFLLFFFNMLHDMVVIGFV